MSNWHVYIVRCADNTLYTGVTVNVGQRIRQHNGEIAGGAKYTRVRQPVSLEYVSKHTDRAEACKEESRIKKLSRQKKIEMINKNK